MIETVGIRFKEGGKVYDFDADGHKFEKGDYTVSVTAETAWGVQSEAITTDFTVK